MGAPSPPRAAGLFPWPFLGGLWGGGRRADEPQQHREEGHFRMRTRGRGQDESYANDRAFVPRVTSPVALRDVYWGKPQWGTGRTDRQELRAILPESEEV